MYGYLQCLIVALIMHTKPLISSPALKMAILCPHLTDCPGERMNYLAIVKSNDYQSLFLHHVQMDGACFVDNSMTVKDSFCFNIDHPTGKVHDEIIMNSYLFIESDQGAFALFKDKDKSQYNGTVLYLDSEAQIHFVGTNPFNFLTDADNSVLEVALDEEAFLSDCEKAFGPFDRGIDEHWLEREMEAYGEFE
jgi:hypothetical protein